MERDAVLYALSTLAQTCAALAAFVGAVGIFRLQTLREQRAGAERELRELAQSIVGRNMYALPIGDVLSSIERFENDPTQQHPHLPRAQGVRERWREFARAYRRSRWGLFAFEAWNLLIICVALVGFNYVSALTSLSWTRRILWLVALGTVAVTFGCVLVWTGEGRSSSETLRNMWNRLRGRTAS
jgi:hypothetical protein